MKTICVGLKQNYFGLGKLDFVKPSMIVYYHIQWVFADIAEY